LHPLLYAVELGSRPVRSGGDVGLAVTSTVLLGDILLAIRGTGNLDRLLAIPLVTRVLCRTTAKTAADTSSCRGADQEQADSM